MVAHDLRAGTAGAVYREGLAVTGPGREVLRAREAWRWVGRERPPFAETPAAGQESVWDYPRPPRIEPVSARLLVVHAGCVVADTREGVRVLETAGAPTYYFPPGDVDGDRLVHTSGRSGCEWKGRAHHFDVEVDGRRARDAAWCYPDPYPEYAALAGWLSFMPGRIGACTIGEERVAPQPGGYYGGWVSAALAGPIKGVPGTEGW
jgi:uncharacterized protein (DUF427 family)